MIWATYASTRAKCIYLIPLEITFMFVTYTFIFITFIWLATHKYKDCRIYGIKHNVNTAVFDRNKSTMYT